jgi:cytochrome c553
MSVRSAGGAAALALVLVTARVAAQAPPPQAPRAIPGITAEDRFPRACVSCHVALPDGQDVRLSTVMTGLREGTDSLLLANAQAAAPPGLRLTGKHPDASRALANIPTGCLTCHGRNATLAPPFNRLIHRIHLTGGEANHFLTMFGGECTHCHKLDPASGAWSIPSGPER